MCLGSESEAKSQESGPAAGDPPSILEAILPHLAARHQSKPPPLVRLLTFRNVIEYFISKHPGDPKVRAGALFRMPHPRGNLMFQMFLDDQDAAWLDDEGRPFGRQFVAIALDKDLTARLSQTDLLIFR